jgi:hypothetical protein
VILSGSMTSRDKYICLQIILFSTRYLQANVSAQQPPSIFSYRAFSKYLHSGRAKQLYYGMQLFEYGTFLFFSPVYLFPVQDIKYTIG